MSQTTDTDHQAADDGGRPAEEPAATGWLGLAAVVAAVVILGLLGGVPALIVVAAIVIMVFLHELGHYFTAKWAGMKVTEFFIGFGPRIWSFRRGETEYGLKPILAGAYVKVIGMSNLEEVDPADEGRTYRQKSYGRRMSVALAGSAMHFLIALILLFVIYTAFGRLSPADWRVDEVTEASAADVAGLEVGDQLVAIGGQPIEIFDDVRDAVIDQPGEPVELVVDRDGRRLTLDATLGERTVDGVTTGFLGVSQAVPRVPDGPLSAAGRSAADFGELTVESVKALGRFFTFEGLGNFASQVVDPDGEAPAAGSSPADAPAGEGDNRLLSIYGAGRLGVQAAESGTAGLLGFLVLINVFIGIFNLVPLLPLDGGHVAIATYERLRSRRGRPYHADVSKLLPVTYAVFLVLVMVGVSALYLDIVDPVNLPGR